MPETSSHRQWILTMLERHELPLVRYALRLLGDEDSAREVVQHTFLQLCEQTAGDLVGREPAWLFRVCRNRALDLLRLRRKADGDACDEIDEYPGREPDPADWAELRDECGELNRQVAQLPRAQREVLALWCEGLSYREIAGVVDVSEGNVRVLMHRAIKQLRHVLASSQRDD